jgi:hypothetical protein|tara:strand:+ start:103 stop:324 length:222 start_codon:yes stop_codon:yes gene_type:complete
MGNTKQTVKKCTLEIIDALSNRRGFDDWLFNLNDDIQIEIEKEIEEIIQKRLIRDDETLPNENIINKEYRWKN